MKEKPILFTDPMVKAILAGTKTQTRRTIASQPEELSGSWYWKSNKLDAGYAHTGLEALTSLMTPLCPHGQLGDQLWVKETFYAYGKWEWRYSDKKQRMEHHFVDMTNEMDRLYQYAAEPLNMIPEDVRTDKLGWYKRPSIFMPRIASRIQLEITNIRVERLQDISRADAIAEGCKNTVYLPSGHFAEEAFGVLWSAINGTDSWTANPWVWVIEFKRVERPA